jgi:hypothetical protein
MGTANGGSAVEAVTRSTAGETGKYMSVTMRGSPDGVDQCRSLPQAEPQPQGSCFSSSISSGNSFL